MLHHASRVESLSQRMVSPENLVDHSLNLLLLLLRLNLSLNLLVNSVLLTMLVINVLLLIRQYKRLLEFVSVYFNCPLHLGGFIVFARSNELSNKFNESLVP
jgi:hypothetical protein